MKLHLLLRECQTESTNPAAKSTQQHLFYETGIELRAQSNEECYLKLTNCESLVTC